MLITADNLISIVDQLPDLSWKGFRHISYFERDLSLDQRENNFIADKEYLKSHCLREFQIACDWLEGCNKIKTINRRYGSYGLKHYAERWARKIGIEDYYVSNGAFIAAATYMGFDFERIHDSPNAYFNISAKSPSIQEDRKK